MVKSLLQVLVPTVVLLMFSALTLAGLNTLAVNFVRLEPARPTPPNEPTCWKGAPDPYEKPQPRPERQPRPRKVYSVGILRGQGNVMPCEPDAIQKDQDIDVK